MDYFLLFQILIISSILGLTLSFMLKIKSYLLISVIIISIFIILELSNQYFSTSKKKTTTTTTTNTTDNTKSISTETKSPALNAREIDLVDSNYAIFKKYNKDLLPFDGLDPRDYASRLNYIYYATSNPYEPITYEKYKTHADKILDKDGTSLITDDAKLAAYGRFYPQLTKNMINAKDCMTEGAGPNSCFQSTQLFENVKNKETTILDKGINSRNRDMVVHEDFTNPMILQSKYKFMPDLFRNAPNVTDVDLDVTSNERIVVPDGKKQMCHHCKLAVCENNYCGLQNELFM